MGTPEYMSPEQVLGAKDVDFRSDLWALAVCAYNMVTGEAAFVATTPHALFFTICKGSYTPLGDHGAPKELEPWFQRAFQPTKEKRYGSAREMVLRFEACLALIDDDDSTHMLAPNKDLRALEGFGKSAPQSQTNPRYEPPPTDDPLEQTLQMGEMDDPFGDSIEDEIQTRQVDIKDVLGDKADKKPSMKTLPMEAEDRASISLGDEAVSVFDKTVNSTSSPFDDLEDPDERPAPDESVPGLAKPRPGADAPAYPDVTDADASGPRPALASHSAESSGARVSVSSKAADALLSKTATSRNARAESSAPASSRRASGTIVTVLGLAAVAGVILFIVSTRSSTTTETTAAPAASQTTAPAEAAPSAEPADSAPPAVSSTAPEEEVPKDMGKLTVLCSPDCLDIKIGDESLGKSPLTRHALPAGKHQVTLVRTGMSPSTVEVEIGKDQHVTRSFDLVVPSMSNRSPPPAPAEIDPYEDEALPAAPGERLPPPLPVNP